MATAKLFKNGGSQAVRLPAEFRFEGIDEVTITRDPNSGDVVLSARRPTLEDFYALCKELGPLSQEEIEALEYRDQDMDDFRDPLADWKEDEEKEVPSR